MINKIKSEIMANKVGILWGMAVGAGTAYYTLLKNIDWINLIQDTSKGIIDKVMSRSAPADIATIKVYIVFIALGGLCGYLIDKYLV